MNYKATAVMGAIVLVVAAGVMFLRPGDTPGIEAGAAQRPIAEVTLPSSLSAVGVTGKAAFDGNCAKCHGVNGAGNEGFGPPLIHIIYEPNHHSDDAFRIAAMNGVRAHHWPFGNMPAQPQVKSDEIETIIAYVREMQRANGIQ